MTNWELGNEIMHNIVDNMRELSNECEKTHPVISRLLNTIALDFGPLVNNLMDDGTEMCPTHGIFLKNGYFFDGKSKHFLENKKEKE